MSFPQPGDRIADRYEIEMVIGQGGFSRIYRARQVGLERLVALKILKTDGSVDDGKSDSFERLKKRFSQEAKLISQLKDRATVVMYDYGATSDGLLYMALEYVDGLTLSQLYREGPLTPERTQKILKQILSSLQEAHSLGALHRDIKPGNIMVYEHAGRADQVKVLDFGIAKVIEDSRASFTLMNLTHKNTLIGTPRYMSPEQIRGQELGPASDIYSVGLVAYQLLVGRKAVEADNPIAIMDRHLDSVPIKLPSTKGIPERLRNIVNRMLRKELALRYASCDEVLFDLERVNDALEDDTTLNFPTRSASSNAESSSRDEFGEVKAPPHRPASREVKPRSPPSRKMPLPPKPEARVPAHTSARAQRASNDSGRTNPATPYSSLVPSLGFPRWTALLLLVVFAAIGTSAAIYFSSRSVQSTSTVQIDTNNDDRLSDQRSRSIGSSVEDPELASPAVDRTYERVSTALLRARSFAEQRQRVAAEARLRTTEEDSSNKAQAEPRAKPRRATRGSQKDESKDGRNLASKSNPEGTDTSPRDRIDSESTPKSKDSQTSLKKKALDSLEPEPEIDEDNELGIFGIE